MTLEQFRAFVRAKDGPWDKHPRGHPLRWKNEEEQLRWYLSYKKAQAERWLKSTLASIAANRSRQRMRSSLPN